MNTTITRPADGSYYPNKPGARTLRDAQPLSVNGTRVSVQVYANGTRATLFAGTRILFDGPAPTTTDIHTWAATHPALTPTTHTITRNPDTNLWEIHDTHGTRVGYTVTERGARTLRNRIAARTNPTS